MKNHQSPYRRALIALPHVPAALHYRMIEEGLRREQARMDAAQAAPPSAVPHGRSQASSDGAGGSSAGAGEGRDERAGQDEMKEAA